MKAWFRGIEKGRTVYQKIGYVDRCGTIGFLQGLSSNNCRTIIRHMSDDNKTVIGRLIVSKAGITFCCFRNYCLGMIGIIYSKGGCKEINKIIYIIVWFIK